MSWVDDAASAAADVHSAFSQSVQYEDKVTKWTTLNAVVGAESDERRDTSYGKDLVKIRDVYILDADISLRIDGVFKINGANYVIEAMYPRIGSRTRCKCRRALSIEVTRPRYRG